LIAQSKSPRTKTHCSQNRQALHQCFLMMTWVVVTQKFEKGSWNLKMNLLKCIKTSKGEPSDFKLECIH
jgi:hypothetical protein